MDLSLYSTGTIKLTAGLTGALVSNATGIPPDKFRILVAQDTASAQSLSAHLRETFKSPAGAFTGACARISMKSMATALNLYVPADLRDKSPFLCSFGVGFVFSPILNVPRMFQLGKIAGDPYPKTFVSLFTTFGGLQKYAANTLMFAPGEALRMMLCFGTKDFLMPHIGGKEDPRDLNIPLFSLKMALIAGPLVSVVETTAALATETMSTIHAARSSSADGSKAFGQVLKETITPAYTARCFVSLCMKNFCANTPLFWIMFMSDFYTKKHNLGSRPSISAGTVDVDDVYSEKIEFLSEVYAKNHGNAHRGK